MAITAKVTGLRGIPGSTRGRSTLAVHFLAVNQVADGFVTFSLRPLS
jgi:hypothetical protein